MEIQDARGKKTRQLLQEIRGELSPQQVAHHPIISFKESCWHLNGLMAFNLFYYFKLIMSIGYLGTYKENSAPAYTLSYKLFKTSDCKSLNDLTFLGGFELTVKPSEIIANILLQNINQSVYLSRE